MIETEDGKFARRGICSAGHHFRGLYTAPRAGNSNCRHQGILIVADHHWCDETGAAADEQPRTGYAREGAEIHWCDETGAAADEQSRKGYAREGDPARIEVPKPTSG